MEAHCVSLTAYVNEEGPKGGEREEEPGSDSYGGLSLSRSIGASRLLPHHGEGDSGSAVAVSKHALDTAQAHQPLSQSQIGLSCQSTQYHHDVVTCSGSMPRPWLMLT